MVSSRGLQPQSAGCKRRESRGVGKMFEHVTNEINLM